MKILKALQLYTWKCLKWYLPTTKKKSSRSVGLVIIYWFFTEIGIWQNIKCAKAIRGQPFGRKCVLLEEHGMSREFYFSSHRRTNLLLMPERCYQNLGSCSQSRRMNFTNTHRQQASVFNYRKANSSQYRHWEGEEESPLPIVLWRVLFLKDWIPTWGPDIIPFPRCSCPVTYIRL